MSHKIIAALAALIGLAALLSVVVYGATGSFWWVEVQRQEIERGFILFAGHVFSLVAGIAGVVWWFIELEV
jgi:hypothetical protein